MSHSTRCLIAVAIAATIWGFVDVRRRGYRYPHSPIAHKSDFTVYTEAGAAFFDGREPYAVANPRGWTYLYPPLFAMLLAPLHALPMQDQVTIWFFFSLLVCWACWRECKRIMAIVCQEESTVAEAWRRYAPWLVVAAVVVALLPTLNCLQRGQVGILKLYLLLLGLRCILAGRSYRGWLVGGIVLAMPIVLKIVPLLPVAFLLFWELLESLRGWRNPTAISARPPSRSIASWHGNSNGTSSQTTESQTADAVRFLLPSTPPQRRFLFSTLGVACGLGLFLFIVPAAMVGWNANLRHLNTWAQFMLTKADDGGMDPRSGNSHSARNQSLGNALYRLGNFGNHLLAYGPDDRLVERFDAPKMVMDTPLAKQLVLAVRATLLLALLALAVQLARADGNRLNLAVGFTLACAAMLMVSPVARGHYFLMLAPSLLLVPLWFSRQGLPRTGLILATVPPLLSIVHYVLLPYAGRIGLLGIGTAIWFMAVIAMVSRADHWAHNAQRARAAQDAAPRLPLPKAA